MTIELTNPVPVTFVLQFHSGELAKDAACPQWDRLWIANISVRSLESFPDHHHPAVPSHGYHKTFREFLRQPETFNARSHVYYGHQQREALFWGNPSFGTNVELELPSNNGVGAPARVLLSELNGRLTRLYVKNTLLSALIEANNDSLLDLLNRTLEQP